MWSDSRKKNDCVILLLIDETVNRLAVFYIEGERDFLVLCGVGEENVISSVDDATVQNISNSAFTFKDTNPTILPIARSKL